MAEGITAQITVPVDPQEAFTAFTAKMGQWWDPLLSPDPEGFTGIAIDPDGPVEMVTETGTHEWGRVVTWDPPSVYAQDFWLGHTETEPTRLNVTFSEAGATQTLVSLEHSGWTPANEAEKEKYSHWPDLLRRYAAFLSPTAVA